MDSDDDYPMDYGLDALTSLMEEDDFGNVFNRDEENCTESDKPATPQAKLSFEDAIAGPSQPQHAAKKVKKTSKESRNNTCTESKSEDGEREGKVSSSKKKIAEGDADCSVKGGDGDTEDNEADRSKEDLEEELRQMREKMMMLEKQLKKQKSQEDTSPPVAKKSKPGGGSTEIPQMSQQKEKTRNPNRLDFLSETSTSSNSSQESKEETKRSEDRLSFLRGDPSDVASTPKQKVKTSPKKKSPTESFYGGAGGKKRVAHQPKHDRGGGGNNSAGTPRPLEPSVKHNRNLTAGVKRELSPSADTLAPKRTKLLESQPVLEDKYSQIRIVNPKISSEVLKGKMEGRKMVRMSVIKSHIRNGEIEGDWVTMGVIVKKIPPKTSSNGKTFSIWKMSDLRDSCSQTVSFFLFGDVHKNHWKNDEGTVIGLCNPSIMKARDKGDTDVALTVDNHLKVMVMGRSKDLGFCKATKKAGGQCENFVNKDKCEYCEYHVHSQYKKSKAKRGEFNSVIGPPDPKKKMMQKMMGKNESFMYGGHTYTTSSPAQASKKKPQVNLDFLRVAGARSVDAAVKANIVDKMEKKKDEETLKKLAAPSQAMQELLSAPTLGSMNLIKHLGTEEKKAQPKVKVVSASELLKSHKQEMLDMRRKNRQTTRQPSQVQVDLPGPSGAVGTSPEMFYPKLGKGLCNPQDIVMFGSPPQKTSSSQKAMQRAIARIKDKGPLTPENPNAVKKKLSPKAQEAVKSKVEETTTNQEPPAPTEEDKKKAKLFGDTMDKNSEEYKKLVQAKSSHTGALSEAQLEMQEKYFAELEKKERMEDKMATISYVKCKVVSCKKCKYTFFSPGENCKKENHPLLWHEGVKRFFKCMNCSKRCVSLHRYPKVACKNCGSSKFERTTMLAEKKGPKLDSETLNVRGEDEMFLNRL